MQFWFYEQRKKWRAAGGQGSEIVSISFPTEKPAAFITLDDRAITFNGTFPDVNWLRSFQPWYRAAVPTLRAADGGKPNELREDDDSCQCLMCGDVHRRR